jgi:hypothetical protein
VWFAIVIVADRKYRQPEEKVPTSVSAYGTKDIARRTIALIAVDTVLRAAGIIRYGERRSAVGGKCAPVGQYPHRGPAHSDSSEGSAVLRRNEGKTIILVPELHYLFDSDTPGRIPPRALRVRGRLLLAVPEDKTDKQGAISAERVAITMRLLKKARASA